MIILKQQLHNFNHVDRFYLDGIIKFITQINFEKRSKDIMLP